MDEDSYNKALGEQFLKDEDRCARCGECCGAFGSDPCANLVKEPSGRYYCKSYKNRIGEQITVSGKKFTCVAIRDVLARGVVYTNCAYRNK